MSHVSPDDISDRYLKALSAALMGSPPQYAYRFVPRPQTEELQAQFDVLRDDGIELVTQRPPSPDLRESGAGWLPTGMTMLGALRLAQLRDAVETVVREGIEGDLIESATGRCSHSREHGCDFSGSEALLGKIKADLLRRP